MKKLTLSIREDLAEKAKARTRRLGSLSRIVEDFLESIDGEGLADALCRELGLDCAEPLTTPGEIAAQRPRALGPPAATLVAEMRKERAGRL